MKKSNVVVMFAMVLSLVACAHENDGRVEYPTRARHQVERTVEGAQDSTSSLYEENKEWVKEKASQVADVVVDYSAAGVAKAIELKDDFKNKVEKYSNK